MITPELVTQAKRILVELCDINAEMVREGYAWAFVKYSTSYVQEEAEARALHIGIWQGKAEPAWEFREHRWADAELDAANPRTASRAIPAGQSWWCSPGVGVAHWVEARIAEQVAALRAAAERAGGSLVLLAADLELKRQVGAWGTAPATLPLMEELKNAFDPRHALSPGRYVV